MTYDREAERQASLARLAEYEELALAAGERAGQDVSGLVSRIRATRARWDSSREPLVIHVQVPAGATSEERTNAVIAAVAERLNHQEES